MQLLHARTPGITLGTPIQEEKAPTITTEVAALSIGKHVATLHRWAKADPDAPGIPLRPINRIGRHIHWSTFEVCALMGLSSAAPAPVRSKDQV